MGPHLKKRMRSRWFRKWWTNVNSWQDERQKAWALLKVHDIPNSPLSLAVNRLVYINMINRRSRGSRAHAAILGR